MEMRSLLDWGRSVMPASSDDDEDSPRRPRLSSRFGRCTPLVFLSVGGIAFVGIALALWSEMSARTLVGASSRTSVRLLVIGDWGRCAQWMGTKTPRRKPKESSRDSCENQTRLVPAFAATAQALDAQAVLSVGDNFYGEGLDTVDDDAFHGSFTEVYPRSRYPSLDIPWHSIMGNHDHRSRNISCQLDTRIQRIDPRWHAYFEGSLSFPDTSNPIVEVVMFDTTPFDEKYLNQAGAKPGHENKHPFTEQRKRGATPADPSSWRIELQSQLDRFEQRLARARQRGVRWLVVMGHNPIRDSGDHSDTASLVALVDPLMWKHGVHAYFNGHDHHLEYAQCSRCCDFRRSPQVPAGGPVVINEALDDDAGEWVELYNAGDEIVRLHGWAIRTESMYADTELGRIQETIQPGEFIRVDLKLKDGSDHVWLRDATGQVVSELAWGFGEMRNGLSVGRHPDGSSTASVAMQASAGRPNSAALQASPHLPVGAPPALNLSGWLPAPREAARLEAMPDHMVHYFTVGAGGGLGKHAVAAQSTISCSKFFQRINGFLTLQASADELILKFVDEQGNSPYMVRIDQ